MKLQNALFAFAKKSNGRVLCSRWKGQGRRAQVDVARHGQQDKDNKPRGFDIVHL